MRITVTSSGIDEAIKALEGKKLINKSGISKVLDEVAKRGGEKALQKYSLAKKDGNDMPSVNVAYVDENTREIFVAGEDVAFIEFGTGILNEEHPLQNEIDGIVGHGYYGKGLGADPRGWWYNGKRTIGIDAQRCLYETGKELEREIPQIIREVIK